MRVRGLSEALYRIGSWIGTTVELLIEARNIIKTSCMVACFRRRRHRSHFALLSLYNIVELGMGTERESGQG